MTLGSFAIAVNAPPKWVQNAHAVLGIAPAYTPERARLFALTRVLERGFDIPLKRAYRMAAETLQAPDRPERWCHLAADGITQIAIDRDRFFTVFLANLSRAREGYAERRRGRPRVLRRAKGVAAAVERGMDVTLIRDSLRRTPAERLRRLDDDLAFVSSLTVTES